MLKGIFFSLHELPLARVVRNKISKWPWYQGGLEGNILSHYLKMKSRVLLSLFSDSVRMGSEARNRIRITRKMRNSESCEVLVIGNGPSAKSFTKQQYLRFKNSGGKVLVLNGFVDSPLAKFVEPDYYCLMDLGYWNPIQDGEFDRLRRINEFLTASSQTITLMQPNNQVKLFENYQNYLFFDGRSIAGVRRVARPDKPWGLVGSVAMVAIASLKFLGHQVIYFTGLDSDMSRHYFVNDFNEILWDSRNYYHYMREEKSGSNLDRFENTLDKVPSGLINNFYDLLHADAIYRRDMRWLMKENCINVGGDRTNDAAPRACLLSI